MNRGEADTLMEKRRQAWVSKDVETYLSLFSNDFVFSDGTENHIGLDAWAAVVRGNYERFTPVDWEVHTMAVEGSNILAEWTATIVPTGMEVRVSTKGMSITQVRDCLFCSHREYRWPLG